MASARKCLSQKTSHDRCLTFLPISSESWQFTTGHGMGSRDSLGKTLGGVLITLLLTLSAAAIEHNITLSLPPVVVHGPRPHVLYNAGRTEHLRCLAKGAGPVDCDEKHLQCEAHGSQPLRYEWYRNGELLPYNDTAFEQRSDQPGTLIIRTRTGHTDGYYQCKASNDAGIAMSNITLLQEAVLLRVGSRETNKVSVYEGERLTLNCSHVVSIPASSLTYEWYWSPSARHYEKNPVILSDRVSIDDKGQLVFSNVLMEDSHDGGIYKCKASNLHKRENKFGSYYNVTVSKSAHTQNRVPKLIYHSNSPTTVLEGDDITLKCVFAGLPTPEVNWKPPAGAYLMGRNPKSRWTHEFQIQNVQAGDAGYYECSGNNTAGKSYNEKIQLKVEAKPSWRSLPQSQNTTEGSTVVFRCEAYGTPTPDITWYHNDQPITDAESGNTSTSVWLVSDGGQQLTINDVTLNDTSTIHCNISNRHGYQLYGVYLVVFPRIHITTTEEPEETTIPTTEAITTTDATTTTKTTIKTTTTTSSLPTTTTELSNEITQSDYIEETTEDEHVTVHPNVVEGIQISADIEKGNPSLLKGIKLGYIVFPLVVVLALILLIIIIVFVRRRRRKNKSYNVNGKENRFRMRRRGRGRDYDSDDSGYNGEDERPMRIKVIDIIEQKEPTAEDHLDPTPIVC